VHDAVIERRAAAGVEHEMSGVEENVRAAHGHGGMKRHRRSGKATRGDETRADACYPACRTHAGFSGRPPCTIRPRHPAAGRLRRSSRPWRC
jgi:hypothetical protein